MLIRLSIKGSWNFNIKMDNVQETDWLVKARLTEGTYYVDWDKLKIYDKRTKKPIGKITESNQRIQINNIEVEE